MTPACKECRGTGEIRTMVSTSNLSGLGETWVESVEECDRCEGDGCEPLDNDDANRSEP